MKENTKKQKDEKSLKKNVGNKSKTKVQTSTHKSGSDSKQTSVDRQRSRQRKSAALDKSKNAQKTQHSSAAQKPKTKAQKRAEANVIYATNNTNRPSRKLTFAEYVETQNKQKLQEIQTQRSSANVEDTDLDFLQLIKEINSQPKFDKPQRKEKLPTEKKESVSKAAKKLKIMFLGGVGEIGKNMTVFEYGNDIVIVDAGMSFPTAEMPGVDIVIPDVTYLKENRQKIRGLLLTHGHEDHIGGVPYLLKEIETDVYGSKLTLALVENKLIEHGIQNYRLRQIDETSKIQLGCFGAEFVHVCHSIADSMAISLKTPLGTVFLTGDFKIDYTPIGGHVMNIHRIAELGKNGVALLLAESTNVERPGYTMSEVVVTDTLRRVFNENVGRRLIIATFASNVDRVQQIIDIAKESGRKIAFGGRSMSKVVDTARKAGMITFEEKDVVDIEKTSSLLDGEVCILATGTQGEPMSALTRMASGQFNKIAIGKNDTIVISASPIPGNEKDVYKVINNLYRLGATVIYSSLADVHVSGHACREELKLMHTLLKPKFFIPIHGEYRHLSQHARLAISLGMQESNIAIPEIGDVVELTNRKIAIKEKIPSGIVLVDGLMVGDVGQSILKDRRTLAEEGIVLVLVSIDTTQGIVTSGPEIISRGCIYTGDDSTSETVEDLKTLVVNALKEVDLKELNVTITKQLIQKPIKSYFRKKYDRYPMIVPIIIEN